MLPLISGLAFDFMVIGPMPKRRFRGPIYNVKNYQVKYVLCIEIKRLAITQDFAPSHPSKKRRPDKDFFMYIFVWKADEIIIICRKKTKPPPPQLF